MKIQKEVKFKTKKEIQFQKMKERMENFEKYMKEENNIPREEKPLRVI